METGRHCAYNVTRNVLLSERVWFADESLGQAELLELVMNGPGLDRHAGLWINRAAGWVDLPRLFAVDFAYLNERDTIIELGGVGPGAGFPPIGEGVAGALILANRRLVETGAVPGDHVRICRQVELPALVKAASQPAMDIRADHTHTDAGEPFPVPQAAFQVSRYSEFVFEPFGGSLVYLPPAEAPPPQSTEYFLPEGRPAAARNADVPESIEIGGAEPIESPVEGGGARLAARPQKPAKKKTLAPQAAAAQEEPHFYTPQPIQFFDPAATPDHAQAPDSSEAEETPTRQSPQLSPELKSAFLQIDEQLRREKEDLEKPERKKIQPKDRKKKARSKMPAKKAEELADLMHPAWEELAEPVRPSAEMVAAEAEVVEKVFEETEIPPTMIELQPEPTAIPPALESVPEIVAETSVSAFVPGVEENPPSEWTSSADEISLPVDAAPPELVELAEEILPPTAAAPPMPQEPGNVIAGSAVATNEPASVWSPPQSIPETPHEIAPPVQAPAEKPKPAKEKVSLGERLQRWIGGEIGNKRRGERTSTTGLVAFYWSGGAPRPHEIVNISKSGFYIRTKELWLPDTLVRMTLQRQQQTEGSGKESISVLARVVRIDEDGVGHEFVTTESLRHARGRDVLPEHGTNPKELEKFLGKG